MISIPARPFNFEAPLNQIALIVVDMQRDFLEVGGFGSSLGNDVERLRSIIPSLLSLINTFRKYNAKIIYLKEGHKPDLSDCPNSKFRRGENEYKIGDLGPLGRILINGEPGNQIIPELSPKIGEIIIEKPGKGGFYKTNLNEQLESLKISHLIFSGVTTEVCVQSTMREAMDRGYETLVVEDATESYFAQFKKSALEMIISQGGIVGCISNVATIMNSLETRPI